MSFFETIELLPEDPILGLPKVFNADPRPQKVNLGIGAYQDADGKPYILTTVRDAEAQVQKSERSKEYLPIEGNPVFIERCLGLVFGSDNTKIKEGHIFGAQGLGGTGALRLGAEFLAQNTSRTVFLSQPSWPNHKSIFSRAGLRLDYYKYYDEQNHRIDFAGLCASIKLMPPGSVILLQACCHNPTGIDPTFAQWQELSELIKKHKIFPYFDFAYQGFGAGFDEDAKAIRYFTEQGHELMVASSYSKNFGLYGERVGLLSVVTYNKEAAKKVGSQIKQIIRGNYSNPPRYGASIVETILGSPEMTKGWKRELGNLRDRIIEMREALMFGLQTKSLHHDFSFLSFQKGIFSYSGLNKAQVHSLKEKWAIYMVGDGRLNIAGLNPKNLDYVIEAIVDIVQT